MILDGRIVFPERLSNLKVLAFRRALHTVNIRVLSNPETHKQAIVKTNEEAGRARITLPSGTASQLVVNPPRLVTGCADNVQTAQRHHLLAIFWRISSQQNVGTPSRHVRGDCHCPERAGLGDNLRFRLIISRIQDAMLNAGPSQATAQSLRLLNASCSYQNRTTCLVDL